MAARLGLELGDPITLEFVATGPIGLTVVKLVGFPEAIAAMVVEMTRLLRGTDTLSGVSEGISGGTEVSTREVDGTTMRAEGASELAFP